MTSQSAHAFADLALATPVLEALERHGTDPPFSCRAGHCRTCMMKAVDGDVPARLPRRASACYEDVCVGDRRCRSSALCTVQAARAVDGRGGGERVHTQVDVEALLEQVERRLLHTHVRLDADGHVSIEHEVEGDGVDEVLHYVQYDRKTLTEKVRRTCERALREGRMSLEDSARLRRRYEQALSEYTYLSRDDD